LKHSNKKQETPKQSNIKQPNKKLEKYKHQTMKQLNILIAFLLLTTLVKAQTPQGFNYSAVARDASGKPLANRNVGVQLSILKTSPTGALQYAENHLVNTDGYGLFNLVVGNGIVQSGSMSNIQWGNDNHYLKVAIDANGGSNYITMGTTQIMSVPYALHAKNGIDRVSANGDSLYLSNGQVFVQAGSSGNNNGSFTHYIGEQFGGGVIFHLWKDAQWIEHGLIVDLTDLSTSQVWSNIGTLIGNVSQSTWDGLSNCNAIIGQAGHTNSAASLCLNSTNGGLNDWYLPSIDELNILLNYRFILNKILSSIVGSSQLASGLNESYWSSTENSNGTTAKSINFYNYATNAGTKTNTGFVRAIRVF
jgi:hypothetical protein